jgi:hypothetical protein
MTPWRRRALLLLILAGLAGCGGLSAGRPPLRLLPAERPAILDQDDRLTAEGRVWLGLLVNSWRENCAALSVLRNEDLEQCERGLR